MKYDKLSLGIYYANCYIIYDEASKQAAVIDPGGDFEEIENYLTRHELKVKYIIITHGHGDHILAVPELKRHTNAEVCIHKDDSYMISTLERKHFMSTGIIGIGINAERYLEDGEILKLGENTELQIIHTPGHSKGGICIKCENHLFSGDTLFLRSIGRADLEGSSYKDLINSIQSKLMILPDEMIVHPGHGEATTIGSERKHNPFLR